MLAAVRRAKKDTRLLPLRDGRPVIKLTYHPVYIRAIWQEWKRTGLFPDSNGDPLDINPAMRQDVLLYDRCYQFQEALERIKETDED